MIHITTERVRRLLALATLCALAAVVGLALSGRTDPLHRLVGAVDAHASVRVIAENGATLVVPAGAAQPGAEIAARTIDNRRSEFGWWSTGGDRVLPDSRFLSPSATPGRWYRSGEITIGGNDDGADQPTSLRTTRDPTAISAGYHHTCALRTNGAIECWGANEYGQTDTPTGSYAAVSAGGWHTCGLRTNGAIECWGANDYGQTDAPTGSYTAVSAGGWHTCGLRTNGAIECWGANDYGQTDTPGGSYTAVSAGAVHTCGLRTAGEIKCWGGSRKQPNYDDAAYGQTNAPSGSFRAVSAGGYHTCGLRESGAIECWGDNRNGQADAPTRRFRAVSAGNEFTCGLDNSFLGVIWCWGRNHYGQTDTPGSSYTAVSAGGAHTCGLRTDREISCWGFNNGGQATSPTEPLDQQIAERFAPFVHFAEGERYFPVPVELMIQHSTLHYTRNGQRRTKAPGTYRLTDLISHNGEDSYLDLANGKRGATGARVVYARVAETAGGVLVQYWFFYLYNATGEPTHSHEGDWEGVQLWFAGLDRDDLLTAIAPTQLGYAAHEGGWAYTQDAQSCAGIVNPVQPSVYVARNRHASYIQAGSGGDLDKSFRGWARDQFQGNGATWVLRGRDLPNVGGELGYELRMLPTDLNQSWLAWNGRWGDTSGSGGPKGPAFKPHFRFAPATIAGWSEEWSQDRFTCHSRAGAAAPSSTPPTSVATPPSSAMSRAADERTTSTNDEPEPLPPIGDGSLIVLAGTSDLYQARVVDGALFKRLILNPAVFDGYGFQLSAVRSVEQAEFDRWTTTDLARLGDDARVWRLFPDGGEGVRRWLDITPQQFEAAGFDWDAVISINQTEFNAWREGPPITAAELGLEGARDDTPPARVIAVGQEHACALLDSGAIECWGANYSGQTDAPGGSFSAVSVGGDHTCGLRPSKQVECWGYNEYGQTDAPGGSFSAVSTGGAHTCGLRTNGAVECWGNNDDGQADAPGGSFSAVSAGVRHTCGLRPNGAVECWGNNDDGQADAPGGSFSVASAGVSHTCGLRPNGAVECWGDNSFYRANAPGGPFTAVSTGYSHTCGLRTNGAVECWGDSSFRRANTPGGSFSAVSVGYSSHICGLRPNGAVECWEYRWYRYNWSGQTDAPGGSFSAVSAGYRHTCGVRASGAVECWGENDAGQTDAPGGSFSAVSAGYRHTCGVRASGAVECWGRHWLGQTDVQSEPFTAVSAGWDHTCGLRPSGAVECWGPNYYGETDAPGGSFSAVSAGESVTCGLRPSGAVECWGRHWLGQTDVQSEPFTAVSAGRYHTCGLRPNGTVECWGSNYYGKTDAPGGSFSAVSAGGHHTCGLRTSGAVECWGYTFDGQAQPPVGKHTAISSGEYHACALSEDGTVSCWMIYNGAADVPAWLREPGTAPGSELSPVPVADATSGRIVARLAADGRTEFGWQPTNGERILPSSRYFPTNAQPNRWLRSSPIELNGIKLGRINARRLADGRIEFAFTPTDGERILPPSRFFPADAELDRWLRSTEIELNR